MKRIRKEHRKDIERLLILKEHHLSLASAAQAELARLLRIGYGVDIINDNFDLDLDKGTLTPQPKVIDIDALARERGNGSVN